MRLVLSLALLFTASAAAVSAAEEEPTREPAAMACPVPLGIGVGTRLVFCDVVTARDAASGIIITIPPHAGPVTLRFDLHNRHVYSEAEVQAGIGFRRYTATVGVLTADNTLIDRAVVQNEFRTAADLADRIAGGAGPDGLKAVAPVGIEPIVMTIPAAEDRVSIVGEKLTVEQRDGTLVYVESGTRIASVSNVTVEYQPPMAIAAPLPLAVVVAPRIR
jgi:hypothetical protein